ncbi:MAG: efflux RND transporter permease subunit [Kiloniellaceae bacterium]
MIRIFAAHPTGANLLMVLLIAAGILALPSLQRETFPDFSTDSVQVQVVYPGASAGDVEESICQRIEDAVDGVTDLDEIRCEAREGIGTATIDMVEGGNLDRFVSEVATEIDAIDTFPELSEDPVIRQLNLTDLVVSIAITGPMAEPDLKVFAEDVKDRLTRLPEVSQVELQGFSQRQIRIALDSVALRQYGLSVADIAAIVERQSIDLPSGTVETGERDVLVRFADERRSPRAFENLVVRGSETGAELRLGQIAEITDRFERDEERVFFNGQRAALLQVSKTKSQDTLTVKKAVEAFLEAERPRAPPTVEFALTRDLASIVQDRLSMLVRNGEQGLLLVFLVMWLFFSFRFSFWVAMGLPTSFLGSIFVMTLLGLSINMLTMVALLIAIGLIMDDSIVIAENIASHLRRGKSPLEAAVGGTRQVAPGVVSSFLTSACVFLPLAFLAGDLGKILKVVPVVLIVTLSISLIEAFLILPHHVAHAAARPQMSAFRRRFGAGFDAIREHALGRAVDLAVEWRYLTLGLVVMALLGSVSMIVGGKLKFRAFPDLDGDVVEARILLPQGTPLARTEAVVAQVTDALRRVDQALRRVDQALAADLPEGQALVRNVLVEYNVNAEAFESGPHIATVTADLVAGERRNVRVDDILNLWRTEVGTVPDVISLSYKEPRVGPAGVPIDIRLQGSDLHELKDASGALITWLRRYTGVVDLNDDLRPGKPEIRLKLREGATGLGLDATAIASQLRVAYHGRTAAEIQVGPESFEINVQLAAEDQDSLADLEYFAVTLPNGGQVPLSAVAKVELGRGFARIARIDGRRTVTVRGDVDPRAANLNEILADTRARFIPELEARYPKLTVSLEGESAEQAKTQASILRGFLFGLLGVFVLLSFQFRDYVEPVIVMLAIPLALIGVIWGHLLMGLDLSMPSMIGYASLAGIVVNDSILMVIFIKIRTREGAGVVEAARLASRGRFRPVLLTSLTTIAGLLPLLFERSLQAQVLVPLVTSLAFGLMASTVLVLFVVPTLYAVLHDFGLSTISRETRAAGPAPRPAE